MSYRSIYLLIGGVFLFLSSCVKDEALNMEADILKVSASEDVFLLEPVITNSNVTFYLKPGKVDLKNVKLNYTLTAGAVMSLDQGSFEMPKGVVDTNAVVLDKMKNGGVLYNVVSQDRAHSKKYLIKIVSTDAGFVPTEFGFEEFEIENSSKYTIFYNQIDGQNYYNWASGNTSFYLTLLIGGIAPMPDLYPTKNSDDAISGQNAALLETLSTGSFGAMFKKPIAAGNLFIGSFDSGPVLSDPLSATRFGLPFNKIPVALEGYYKYTPGTTVTDKNGHVLDQVDECDIYAVFYNRKELEERESDPKKKVSYLTGQNIMTDPSVVAIAKLPNGGKTNGFMKFSLPFEFRQEVVVDGVINLDYNIAIVMSSSKYGDDFVGAVGSKLIVDDLKLITK